MFAVANLNSQLVYAPDFIWITVPIEYNNNSSQTPRAERIDVRGGGLWGEGAAAPQFDQKH